MNGGAQARPLSDQSHKELIATIEKTFLSLPKISTDDPRLKQLFMEWLGSQDDAAVKANLHTTYNIIEKTINPLVIKW